jgi:tetratricopeptide (TPR) repeat protein
MRLAACLLVLLLAMLVSMAAAKAEAPDPFAAMNAAGEAFQKEGLDAAIAILRKAIDDTRVAGKADPVMAPAFGMLSDAVRNAGDAVEALRLVEEGLALAADPAADSAAAAMLSISRAYALGALGRYDEAIAAADAALLNYAETFGGEDGATGALRDEKAGWVEARRNELADRAQAVWAEADRLQAGGGSGEAVAALPLRREVVRLYEAAGGFPKSLASALAGVAQTASMAGELAAGGGGPRRRHGRCVEGRVADGAGLTAADYRQRLLSPRAARHRRVPAKPGDPPLRDRRAR